MLYYLIALITTFAGATSISFLDRESKWFSLRMLAGFIFPVIFIFLANSLFSVSLSALATIYFLVVISSMFSVILFNIRRGSVRNFVKSLKHPALLVPLIAWVVFLVQGFSLFEPFAWDEYSHWVTMPKQMFSLDQLASNNFPYTRFVTYPPGWPIAIIYPSLVLKELFGFGWSSQPIIYAQLILGFISLSIAFDLFNVFCEKAKSKVTLSYGWITYLAILPFALPLILKTTILIETPQIFVLFAIFVIIWVSVEQLISDKLLISVSSVLLLFGYLLKDSFVVAAIPVIVFLISQKKAQFKNLLMVLGPMVLAAVIWKLKTKGFVPVFLLTDERSFIEIWEERSSILPKMLIEVIKLPRGIDYFLLPLAIFCFRISKNNRFILRLACVYGFGIFIGLYWLYMNSFDTYEALKLASFHRYFVPFLKVTGLLAALMSTRFLMEKVTSKAETTLSLKSSLVAIVAASCVFFFFSLESTYIANLSARVKDPIVQEGERLAQILAKRNLSSSNIYMIAQHSDRFEYYKGIYSSLFNNQVAFKIHFGTSWGEEGAKTNYWMEETSQNGLIERFSRAQALWIINSDPWMDEVLIEILEDKKCPDTFEKFFLIKSPETGEFECIPKQASIDPTPK